MIKKILTATIVLSLLFTLSLVDGAKVSGYSQVTYYNEPTVSSPSLPDLIIETITWSPEYPAIGNTVTFTVTIKNQGSGKSDSSKVAYYIDDNDLALDYVNPIDPGDSATETFTWTAEAGSHTIKAVADSNNEVTESDETNNVKMYSLSTLAPDLIIESITSSPEIPSKGDTVTFSVTVKNQGNGKASNSRVDFYIDGSSRGYQEVPEIGAGSTATKTFTWVAQAGAHAIKAVADGANYITESDETNNEKTITFSPAPPDLIIESITWLPEIPAKGDSVTFNVIVKNQGSGRSGSFHVALYIGSYQFSDTVNSIEAGATDNATFIWSARAGSYTIKAIADSSDKVLESNETNNEKTVTLSTLPDLIIETITWEPESFQKSDNVTFTVTIKNQGVSKAGSFRVHFYVDLSFKGYQDVEEIDADATVTKTFIWIARTGSHSIKVIADEVNQVTESDETNNAKRIAISTLPPDFIIETITWSPESALMGDTVTFTVTIKNQGSGKSDYSYVTCYIDDNYLASDYVNPIDAGASANETFTWTAEAGSHTIKAVADSENEVAESNETNNEKTVTLSTIAPDLIIETITGLPASPPIGETVTFTVTIKNQGSDIASPSRVHFYIDDSSRGYQDVPEIVAGATATKTFTWIAQAGSHDIKAVADSNDTLTESDETNNEKTVTFPTPDLIIETVTWSPVVPSIGETVTFTVTIKNQGIGKAGSSRVDLYIDGSSRGYQDVQEIDAGATATKTFTWVAETGSHTIKAVADSDDEVNESDETNNEKTVTFSTLPPDLIIETIAWLPADPSIEDTVTFTVTIKNQGSGGAGSSRVDFYIDGSSRGYQDVQEIDAGATATKTFTWTAEADSHAIKAVADSNNEVTESDETNNEKTVTLSVSLPPTPTPAPAPGTEPPEAPAGQPTPIPSPERGLWPDLLFVLAAVVLGGTAIIVILKSRQQQRD